MDVDEGLKSALVAVCMGRGGARPQNRTPDRRHRCRAALGDGGQQVTDARGLSRERDPSAGCTSLRLNARIPVNTLRVAESGIHTGADVSRLRSAGYQAFLIGESLMKEPNPGAALSKLLADAALEERRAEVASQ